MKKLFAYTIILSMILSLVSLGVYAEEGNVLLSESFENGKGEWKFGAGCKIVTENATDGKSSVYYIDDAEDGTPGVYSPAVKVTPGTEYTAAADFKGATGTVKLWLRFYDASDKNLGTASATHSKGIATMVAPENSVKAQVFFAGNKVTTGEAYIDNVRLVEGGASAADIKPQAPTTTPSVDKPSEGADKVLFSESFEDGADLWKRGTAATTAEHAFHTTEKASDGKASVCVVDPDNGSYGFVSGLYPAEPGGIYKVSYDAYNEGGMGAKLFFAFFDKDAKRISSTSFGISGNDQWKSVSKNFTAPAGTASFRIYLTGTSAPTGKTYIDNIKVAITGKVEVDENSPENIAEVNAKLKDAKPGDIIEIPDGIYNGVTFAVSASGTEAAPIILKAENPGKAKFTGESRISVTGSYVIVDGVIFEKATTGYLFIFDVDSHHCQIKNSAFINCDPVDNTAQRYMYVKGQYNKVSNCFFSGKTRGGMMIEVVRKADVPDYHVIENCYFGNYKESNTNGYETIRIGISGTSLSSSYTTVQGCFFEKCNAEVETISVKSCENFILNNTLYNNKGAITLRHGNGTLVEGNLVIGGDKTSVITGVRVIGENHKVKNNYFYNLPETSVAVYVSDGNPNPLIHEYYEAKNVEVSNNTFVNVDMALVLGERSPSDKNSNNKILPPSGVATNNAVISYKGKLPSIPNKEPDSKITFAGNVVEGKEIGYNGELPSGIEYGSVSYDVKDGYVAPNGIGADIEVVKKAPTSPFDVMPSWVKKDYYDTGKLSFEVVKGDPFNTELTADKLLPKKDKVNVTINGYKKEFDVDPQLINERTMVPMRAIFEEFGALVSWDEGTATATATSFGTEVKITENSDTAYVNGSEMKLDSPAVIIDGRFLVPLRFISESFGAEVGWVDATQTATIIYESKEEFTNFAKENNITNMLYIKDKIQSGDDGSNSILNAVDAKLDTRWAVRDNLDTKEPAYGVFDLGSVKTLDKIYIAMAPHATRISTYEFYISEDGVNYTLAVEKVSLKHPEAKFENYDVSGKKARYVKYVGYGNNENAWNNIAEVVITGK